MDHRSSPIQPRAAASLTRQAEGEPTETLHRRRRRWIAGAFLLVVVALGLLALHYVPYYSGARSALDGARQLAAEARSLQVGDINRPTLERLRTEVTALQQNVVATQGLLATDPLVAVARALSPWAGQVKTADHVVEAAGHLIDAANAALTMGDQFVAVREGPPEALLGGLVGLVATSTGSVADLKADLDAADAALADARPTATGSLLDATDEMASAIARLRPVIDLYDAAAEVTPSLLGWGGERRYLVLAEDSAELRPGGGYTGTFGIVTFQNGNLTGHDFTDVNSLDLKPGSPFVQPPDTLSNALLGDASWQLADANWSPDWPTSAQDALRLYSNESGDTHIDGVIALTTYALDEILRVIGPVNVPEFGVTVSAGDVTMTTLENTRTPTGEANRQAFLNPLAATVLAKLEALPSEQWQPMADTVQGLANRRLIMVWSADPAVERSLASGPLGGEIRQDSGDYLAVSEANVAPTSKFNLVVHRSSQLNVIIAADGSIDDTLGLSWQNDAGLQGEPYATLRQFSTNQAGLYGAFVRVLVPSGSQLLDVSGQAGDPITDADVIEPEAGRDAIGNYLLMAPGPATLNYHWQSTARATESDTSWTYRLTIQKQPGTVAEPLSAQITLPPGATVLSAPPGASVDGNRVSLTTNFEQDLDLSVEYQQP